MDGGIGLNSSVRPIRGAQLRYTQANNKCIGLLKILERMSKVTKYSL